MYNYPVCTGWETSKTLASASCGFLLINPENNSYIKALSLPQARVWFRYRARAIANVKGNFRHSYADMSCTYAQAKRKWTKNIWRCARGRGTRGGDGLELDPGLMDEDEDDIKIGCCNHGGSSTEDSTWYLVFVAKFVELADITITITITAVLLYHLLQYHSDSYLQIPEHCSIHLDHR